jgi:hypothetical protein
VQFGATVGHGLQFIEHGGDVPRHADLIGLGVVSLSARLMAAGLMVAQNQPAPIHRAGILLPGRGSSGNWKMVKRSPRRPVTITVTLEELARRYLDGASLDDLGVLCGCTATRIRRILVAHGVEIRPRGHDHGKGRSTKFVRR